MLGHILLGDDQMDHGRFFLVIPHHSFIDNGRAAPQVGEFKFLRVEFLDGTGIHAGVSLDRNIDMLVLF